VTTATPNDWKGHASRGRNALGVWLLGSTATNRARIPVADERLAEASASAARARGPSICSHRAGRASRWPPRNWRQAMADRTDRTPSTATCPCPIRNRRTPAAPVYPQLWRGVGRECHGCAGINGTRSRSCSQLIHSALEGRRPQLVLATTQVLDEGVASDHHARGSMGLRSAHRPESGLQSAMVGFDTVVLVLAGVVQRSRKPSPRSRSPKPAPGR